MKKLLIIAFVLIGFSGFAQEKIINDIEEIKPIEEIEEIDCTILLKKAEINIKQAEIKQLRKDMDLVDAGKPDSVVSFLIKDESVFYFVIDDKYYKIKNFVLDMEMESGNKYQFYKNEKSTIFQNQDGIIKIE